MNATKLEIDLTLPVFQKANTREEVAEYMGCAVFLIDREIKRGNLNARKINNGIVRILPSDLLTWLERAQTAPSALVEAQQPRRRGRPRKVSPPSLGEVEGILRESIKSIDDLTAQSEKAARD